MGNTRRESGMEVGRESASGGKNPGEIRKKSKKKILQSRKRKGEREENYTERVGNSDLAKHLSFASIDSFGPRLGD